MPTLVNILVPCLLSSSTKPNIVPKSKTLPALARNIPFRGKGREYSMLYRGPVFLAFILLALLPTPPPLFRKQFVSLSQSFCMSPVEFTDGREGGEGEEPNHSTARKPGLLSIIQHSLV
jgi:hypothetical protein